MQAKLDILKADFDTAVAEKMKCQAEADATAYTINLANRLVGGLSSENVRWRELIKTYVQFTDKYQYFVYLVCALYVIFLLRCCLKYQISYF